jgi:hypothetical protein
MCRLFPCGGHTATFPEMSASPPPPSQQQEPPETEGERRRGNIALLIFFAAIVGLGLWLAQAMMEQRAIDDCVAQGRRNCTPVEVPAR